MGVMERVQPLVAPILADLGLDLYDLEHAGGILKVVIDSPGGVDLEQLALVTRLLSRELDHVDPIPGRYTLEVTSPGLERSLRTPAHFQRSVGAVVNIRTLPHVAGERRLQGVLLVADEAAVTVRVDEAGPELGTERTVALADIERARTVFEWSGAPKPGKGPGKAAGAKTPGTKKPGATRTAKKAGAITELPAAVTDDEVTEEEGAAKP